MGERRQCWDGYLYKYVDGRLENVQKHIDDGKSVWLVGFVIVSSWIFEVMWN